MATQAGKISTKIIGKSDEIIQCLTTVKAVAHSDAAVLILGESGVGKELIAEEIHASSTRAENAFVTVNCASVPRDLFESEFFGHIRGAFTGASRNRAGRFETAHRGTLFLDEVGEIPPELQGKLLRALQQSAFERVGDDKTRRVDVRIITATNRDLSADVETGRFRRDLFYRISTFIVDVPPLRDRVSDVGILAQTFVDDLAKKYRCNKPKITSNDIRKLSAYDWPGNIRELKNVMERSFVLGRSQGILDLSSGMPTVKMPARRKQEPERRPFLTVDEFAELERDNLIAALETASWKISGENGAASLLGIKPTTLASKLRALGIDRPSKESIYQRLGGERTILGLSRDLLGRVQADPQLGRFWVHRSNVSLQREEQQLARYLCAALGGPRPYDGDSMIDVHAGLGITSGDWGVFLHHLRASFETFAVSRDIQGQLLAEINALKDSIITP